MGVNTANAISRQYIIPVLLPAAGTLSMSIKENYSSAVNHRLVTDLPLVISGWLKVDRRSTARIIVSDFISLSCFGSYPSVFEDTLYDYLCLVSYYSLQLSV